MTCINCKTPKALPVDITMAFQPIVDLHSFEIFGYEALVRTKSGGGSESVFDAVPYEDLYWLDQACRKTAIREASRLNLDGFLSINFMPNAVYEASKCIQGTLREAKRCNFPTENIIFEFTEAESLFDTQHLLNIVQDYQSRGFQTAIDDFGAGYSGMNLLCDVQTDIVKVDRGLIHNIHNDPRRQNILAYTKTLLENSTKKIIVEGVETFEELLVLYQLGFRYFQGFYLARPGFECLPSVDLTTLKQHLSMANVDCAVPSA